MILQRETVTELQTEKKAEAEVKEELMDKKKLFILKLKNVFSWEPEFK